MGSWVVQYRHRQQGVHHPGLTLQAHLHLTPLRKQQNKLFNVPRSPFANAKVGPRKSCKPEGPPLSIRHLGSTPLKSGTIGGDGIIAILSREVGTAGTGIGH